MNALHPYQPDYTGPTQGFFTSDRGYLGFMWKSDITSPISSDGKSPDTQLISESDFPLLYKILKPLYESWSEPNFLDRFCAIIPSYKVTNEYPTLMAFLGRNV